MFVATLQIVESVLHIVRYGVGAWGVFRLVLWLVILTAHVVTFTTRWDFADDALVQRCAFWKRTIPYASILSVDAKPGSSFSKTGVAAIEYGNEAPLSSKRTMTVNPQDYEGFLAELERHVPAAVMHA